jgi:hypothetical protein
VAFLSPSPISYVTGRGSLAGPWLVILVGHHVGEMADPQIWDAIPPLVGGGDGLGSHLAPPPPPHRELNFFASFSLIKWLLPDILAVIFSS